MNKRGRYAFFATAMMVALAASACGPSASNAVENVPTPTATSLPDSAGEFLNSFFCDGYS